MSTMHKMDPPSVEEVADGVHAYVQPDGTWFLNNTGIVVGDRSVLMVDQTSTEDRARALMATVGRLADGRPVANLVNTHHHADHTFGNGLVPAGASILAHELARDEVLATGTAVHALFDGPDWGHVEVRAPDVTFREHLTLWCGGRRVELRHLGTAAHTTNDVIVHLPDDGVCFAGDLLFNGGTPFAVQGSVAGWIEVVERLGELDVATWVPGHGPVADADVLAVVAGYLRLVLDGARAGRDAGLTPLEAARDVDLGDYASLSDAERIVGNMHRAYADLTDPQDLGRPIDLGVVLDDMRTWVGGPIVSHA